MAYIGRGLDRGNYLKLDDISSQFDGSLTTFNLTAGGQPFYPGSAFALLVSISGVIQEPEISYQIDSSEITFTGPPGLGEPFFCVAMSQPININTPSDGTITTSKIANGAVTLPKLGSDAISDLRGIGIQSGGQFVGTGYTTLNFIGLGNTFLADGTTLNISIEGGGSAGAGGTWASDSVGVTTTKIVGINTTSVTGTANSEGALQVTGNVALTDGAVLTDQNINTDVFIPSGKNGLVIGTVTVGVGITIDVAPGSTLVVV